MVPSLPSSLLLWSWELQFLAKKLQSKLAKCFSGSVITSWQQLNRSKKCKWSMDASVSEAYLAIAFNGQLETGPLIQSPFYALPYVLLLCNLTNCVVCMPTRITFNYWTLKTCIRKRQNSQKETVRSTQVIFCLLSVPNLVHEPLTETRNRSLATAYTHTTSNHLFYMARFSKYLSLNILW
jgi:hypothetical protein